LEEKVAGRQRATIQLVYIFMRSAAFSGQNMLHSDKAISYLVCNTKATTLAGKNKKAGTREGTRLPCGKNM